MKQSFKTLILLSIILISLESCSKYDEGPALSFRTKKARIEGEWTLTNESINGKEVPLNGFKRLKFTKGGRLTARPYHGSWHFEEKKEVIVISYELLNLIERWTIIKLKSKELKCRWYDVIGDMHEATYKQLNNR